MPKESDCNDEVRNSSISQAPLRRLIQRAKDKICDHIEITEKLLCLWKPIFFRAGFIQNPQIRLPILKFLKTTGDLFLVFRDFPMVKAYLLESEIGRAVFVGVEIEEFKFLFCPCNPIEHVETYSLWSWQLPEKTKEWLSTDVDIVIHGVSRFFPWRAKAAYYTTTPKWITQEFRIPEDCDEPPCGKRFRQLRKIYREKDKAISYYFSQDELDFDFFYHKMYVPYISNRHGDFVYLEPYDYLHKWFRKGGLIVVEYEGKPVAGLLTTKIGSDMYAIEIGLLDGDPKLHEEGFSRVAYWCTVQYAHKLGCEVFKMGGSYSIRSNGVFRYKSTCWYTLVKGFYSVILNEWRFYLNNPSPKIIDYLNQWGIINRYKKAHYAVFFDDGDNQDSEILNEAVIKAYSDGLEGIVRVMPWNYEYVPYAALPHQNPTKDWIYMGRNQ